MSSSNKEDDCCSCLPCTILFTDNSTTHLQFLLSCRLCSISIYSVQDLVSHKCSSISTDIDTSTQPKRDPEEQSLSQTSLVEHYWSSHLTVVNTSSFSSMSTMDIKLESIPTFYCHLCKETYPKRIVPYNSNLHTEERNDALMSKVKVQLELEEEPTVEPIHYNEDEDEEEEDYGIVEEDLEEQNPAKNKRTEYIVPCQLCGKIERSALGLSRHLNNLHSSEEKEVNCPQCEKSCKNELYLMDHQYRQHQHDQSYTQCDHCDFWCLSYQLPAHVKRHHVVEGERKKSTEHEGWCDICDREYKNLDQHMNDKHVEHEPVNCPQCDRSFKYRRYLKDHLVRYHQKDRSNRDKLPKKTNTHEGKCKICDKEYKNLDQHLNDKHVVQDPVNCPQCKASFKNMRYLKLHLVRYHQKDKSNPSGEEFPKKANGHEGFCKICNREYKNLDQHMNDKHVEQERVKCTLCEKSCKNQRYLKDHMVRVHQTEKNCVCDICGAAFKFRHYLKTHVAAAHEGQSFVCQFCGKKCAMKNNLLTHMKRMHGPNAKPPKVGPSKWPKRIRPSRAKKNKLAIAAAATTTAHVPKEEAVTA